MRFFVVPIVAAASLAAGASAGFLGFHVTHITNSDGRTVTFVNGQWDLREGPAVLLNVFNWNYTGGIGTTGTGSGNFWHNDLFNGSVNSDSNGTWSPQLAGDITKDSYVTIGGTAGFANSTSADPGWGPAGFNQPGIPEGGVTGWFNSNPPNLQGLADYFEGIGETFIGQFVTDPGKTWDITVTVGFNHGLGTPTSFADGGFTIGIPAPGALALLGLAGLAGRRRRA
jgi:hypothetical protein